MDGPKDKVDKTSGRSPENTHKSQVAALVEAHKKLVDKAPVEEYHELIEVTAAMVKLTQDRFAAKNAPKDSDNQQPLPMTEPDVCFQKLTAKFSELQNTVNSNAAAMERKGDALNFAAGTLQDVAVALVPLQKLIHCSAVFMSSKEEIPSSAAETAEAQFETTTTTPPMGLQDVDDKSPEAAEVQPESMRTTPTMDLQDVDDRLPEVTKAQPKTITTTSPMGLQNIGDNPPEATESRPKTAAEKMLDKRAKQKEKNRAKNRDKKARRKARRAEEKDIPPATEIPTTEITATKTTTNPWAPSTIGNNPNFAAEVRSHPDDLKDRVAGDLARCKLLGDLSKLCIVCDKQAEKFCPGCHKSARYCSKECQVLDFPIHTKVCSDFAGPAADEKRPSSQHFRVLFFPTFKTKPEVCWAAFRGLSVGDGWFEFEHEDITQFFRLIGVPAPERGEGQKFSDFAQVLEGRPIGHLFVVANYVASKDAPAITDPRLLNQSINALTKPGYLRPWFGPVIIVADSNACFPGLPGPLLAKNIIPRDVHSIFRYLELSDGFCIANPRLYHGETIHGLLINNLSDPTTNVMGVQDAFCLTRVPLAPMDYLDNPIALAFLLGLRWYIRPCLQSRDGPEKESWNGGMLRYVSHVFSVKPVDEGGDPSNLRPCRHVPALGRLTCPPSVIILHGSGNPVEPLHLHTFNWFFDKVLEKKMEASRDSFCKFWDKYNDSQGSPPMSLPSPYKWETGDVIDRLGIHNPVLVRNFVRARIGDIWPQIEANQGF